MDKEKDIEKFYLESEACCTLLCTGDDGKKYVEYEDWQRDVNKLQNIIKKLKQEKKQAVREFAEELKKEIYRSCAHIEIDKTAEIPSYAIPESAINRTIDELIKERFGEEK